MPIPDFTLDGVLPPFVGQEPSGSVAEMSPYPVTIVELANKFATSDKRKIILIGFIDYRRALRKLGFTQGFWWLDGSFLEDKEPSGHGDIDTVFYFRRPKKCRTDKAFQPFFRGHFPKAFDNKYVKATYHVDNYQIDLDADMIGAIRYSKYLLQLFCHQRKTFIWKGLLEVSQDDHADEVALLDKLRQELKGGQP